MSATFGARHKILATCFSVALFAYSAPSQAKATHFAILYLGLQLAMNVVPVVAPGKKGDDEFEKRVRDTDGRKRKREEDDEDLDAGPGPGPASSAPEANYSRQDSAPILALSASFRSLPMYGYLSSSSSSSSSLSSPTPFRILAALAPSTSGPGLHGNSWPIPLFPTVPSLPSSSSSSSSPNWTNRQWEGGSRRHLTLEDPVLEMQASYTEDMMDSYPPTHFSGPIAAGSAFHFIAHGVMHRVSHHVDVRLCLAVQNMAMSLNAPLTSEEFYQLSQGLGLPYSRIEIQNALGVLFHRGVMVVSTGISSQKTYLFRLHW